jgi:Uma2 family endonuclease
VGVPTIKTGPMTVEEFYAFTDTRPDNEKCELIDGEPILNASPSNLHQTIAFNPMVLLGIIQRKYPQSWGAMPGVGVRISDTSLPEPDIFIRPAGTARREPYSRETRARHDGFAERRYRERSDTIELPALGISLPLSETYRDTGLE